jgi:hypothetical protein
VLPTVGTLRRARWQLTPRRVQKPISSYVAKMEGFDQSSRFRTSRSWSQGAAGVMNIGAPGLRPYRPGRGGIEGPSWLEAGLRRKLGKHYAGARLLNVLVYLNFTGQALEFSNVARLLEPYRGEFASVWVMAHHIIGAVFSTPELGTVGGWTIIPGAFDD